MRKEENTEKDELYGKLQVHFIENVEAEESSEEKESDSGNLSDETARKSAFGHLGTSPSRIPHIYGRAASALHYSSIFGSGCQLVFSVDSRRKMRYKCA